LKGDENASTNLFDELLDLLCENQTKDGQQMFLTEVEGRLTLDHRDVGSESTRNSSDDLVDESLFDEMERTSQLELLFIIRGFDGKGGGRDVQSEPTSSLPS